MKTDNAHAVRRLLAQGLLLLALIFSYATSVAAVIPYNYSGTFTSGTLAGRGFYGSYSWDSDSNQLVAFEQHYDGLTTVFTLADFDTQSVTDFETFSLDSTRLDIAFEPANSRSNHVKWYDWSVWSNVDYPFVPMTGDTGGIAQIVPEPSIIGLFGVGLPLLGAAIRRRRQTGV